MPAKPWQYNPAYNTAIVLDGCQFGFEVDDRCNGILCKFRTTADLAPKKPVDIGIEVCPREREYEPEDAATIQNTERAMV